MVLFELDEAANKIREKVDGDANIIVGSTLDPDMEGRMRVSVVATGIDAQVGVAETPVPRRSMAAPLAPAPTEEIIEKAPTPAAAATVAEPEERTLFEDLDAPAEAPAAFVPRQDREPAPLAAEDDLPPPAYQPRPAAPQPAPVAQESDAGNFVARRRSGAPGTPSPEALARLQAAVNRVPKSEPAQPAAPRPAPAAEAEKPRFGINSLINRMTGAQSEQAAQRPARMQPQVTALHDETEEADDHEKIEIPAFLRRQAN